MSVDKNHTRNTSSNPFYIQSTAWQSPLGYYSTTSTGGSDGNPGDGDGDDTAAGPLRGGGGHAHAAAGPLANPELFYAVTVSIYSIGEAVGSIVFGVVYKRWAHKPKAVLMGCILTGLLGSLLFLFAGLPGMLSPWLAFGGRLVQGLWTGGQQVIEQAFLSENVPLDMRTEVTATLGSCAVLG